MAIIEDNKNGAVIIIASVVVVGIVAALVFTKFMLNQTKARMLEEAT
jgi:type II secretory pathway pseudopilin PulG